MRRLLIIVLSIVAFTACHSVSDPAALYASGEDDGAKKQISTGGSVSMEDDSNEFVQVLKEHANYGKLFDSIMESVDEDLEVFDDYIASEEYVGFTFSDLGDKLALDFVGSDGFEMYY